MNFTRKKFLNLTSTCQHKNCAELLAHAYTHPNPNTLLDQYHQICQWINVPQLPTTNKEALSNRFHWHMQHTGLGTKEHRLLPKQNDHPTPLSPSLDLHIYLDHLRSAHNVGSIIRTTEAFQLGRIFLSTQTPDLTHQQVLNAAMGAHQWIPIQHCKDPQTLLTPLILLETSPNSAPLHTFSWPPPPFTLAVGNEEYGCSQTLLSLATTIVHIPLCGRKNSLNVANAFAIAAAHIHTQLRLGIPSPNP